MNLKTNQVLRVFDKYADAYNSKYSDISLYEYALSDFIARVRSMSVKILDVGCGPGNMSRYLLNRMPEVILTGVDFSENMILLAQSNNPEAKFYCMDVRDVNQLDERYHGIVFSFVMPYLDKEEVPRVLKNLYKLLNFKGMLYLSFIEGDYQEQGARGQSSANTSDGDVLHTFYYAKPDVFTMIQNAGFHLASSFRIHQKPEEGMEIYQVLICEKA